MLHRSRGRESPELSRFFEQNILLHTHIEKTAGSTLVRGLVRALGKDRVYDLRPKQQPPVSTLDEEARRELYVLTGHFHFGTQDKYFHRSPRYLACVRAPLDRFRSYYDFVRVRPPHPGYPALAGKSFNRVVEEFLAHPVRANAMARTLTGMGDPTRENVLEHIESRYVIVSPHHHVNDTIRALIPALGGRARRKELYINRSAERTAPKLGGLEAEFNRANLLDAELYEFVCDRYHRWLSELDGRVSSQVSGKPVQRPEDRVSDVPSTPAGEAPDLTGSPECVGDKPA